MRAFPLLLGLILTRPALADERSASGIAGQAAPSPTDPDAAAAATVERLEGELRRLRAVESRYQRQEGGLLEELEQLTRKQAVADRELELAVARGRGAEATLSRLERERAAIDASLARDRQTLRATLVDTYQRRMPDWLTLLLSNQEAGDLKRDLNYLRTLSREQSAALERYQVEYRKLTAARAAVGKQVAEVNHRRTTVAVSRAALEAAQRSKQDSLRTVETRKAETAVELQRAAERLSGLVANVGNTEALLPAATGFDQLKGRLPWPAAAPIRRRFGREQHPRLGTMIDRRGIELAAPIGSNVRAVHAGEVAYADWFKAYGHLVILDHGNGFNTVYAHLAGVSVTRGSHVAAGQVIGLSGDTGALDGPGLYFEIRNGARAEDPQLWLGSQRSN